MAVSVDVYFEIIGFHFAQAFKQLIVYNKKVNPAAMPKHLTNYRKDSTNCWDPYYFNI